MLERLMPRSRVRVLSLLLAGDACYLREIARRAGVALRAAQREVALLDQIGLVTRSRLGRQVFFALRTEHPLAAPLRALLDAERAVTESAPRPERARRGTGAVTVRRRTGDGWRVW